MVGVIKLKEDEVKFLIDLVKKGQKSARKLTRARILLLANQQKGDTEINVTDIERTGRRIGDMETLPQEVVVWTKRRNDQEKNYLLIFIPYPFPAYFATVLGCRK
jgi:hypothetical protein